MPRYRKHELKRMRIEWRAALPETLRRVRARLGLDADARMPDVVLLAEAEHHFDLPDLWPPEEWFTRRLRGEANTDAERAALAAMLQEEALDRSRRGAATTTIRLMGAPKSKHRSRRARDGRN